MRNVVVTQTGVGFSTPVIVTPYVTPANWGVGAILTGTATYNIEVTYDDLTVAPFTTTPNTTARWFFINNGNNLTATFGGNIAYPIHGIRINITSGTGSVELTVVPSGLIS